MAESFFGITDTGRQRDNNEDAFIAERVADRYVIACVIDGVGGYAGGEVAAEISRNVIRERLSGAPADLPAAMKEALFAANQQIVSEKQKQKEYQSMACVLTLAVTDTQNNVFYYAHVGDTRLYLFRDRSLVKVTHDHSFVGFLEDSGRLTEDSAMRHPKRNEINKALGFKPQLELTKDYIEAGESPFLPGDLLLVCSDGLTDLVNRADMSEILSRSATLSDKAAELVAAANSKGGKDNITVVLVQNEKSAFKQSPTRPQKPRNIKRKVQTAGKAAPAPPERTEPARPSQLPEPAPGRQKTIILILSMLSALLLIIILFLLFKKDGQPEEEKITPVDSVYPGTDTPESDSLIMVDTSKTLGTQP